MRKRGGPGPPEIFQSSPDRTLVRITAIGRYRSGLSVWNPCPCSRNTESTVCGSAERMIPRTQFAVQPRFPACTPVENPQSIPVRVPPRREQSSPW